MAARKAYVSLYSMAMAPDGGFYAQAFAPRMGVKSGNSCLNIKDPDLIDEALLREFIRESVQLLKAHGRAEPNLVDPPSAITYTVPRPAGTEINQEENLLWLPNRAL